MGERKMKRNAIKRINQRLVAYNLKQDGFSNKQIARHLEIDVSKVPTLLLEYERCHGE